ncbi:MAG: hypothetical protein JWM68_2307 [Verrucomicrobiales bacterium]|nr:hypothetical protein [Verrucomicrobiales bacterium]
MMRRSDCGTDLRLKPVAPLELGQFEYLFYQRVVTRSPKNVNVRKLLIFSYKAEPIILLGLF